jgi:DNA-binding GntR family transcriptional regulator
VTPAASQMPRRRPGGKVTPLLVPRSTLDTVVYDELRKRIVTLVYRPGSLISEVAVAEELGVSRTPVHQAFLQLSHEDLLRILPQRGALVSELSIAKVKEAQFVRESLEISAFGEVAKAWNAADPVYQEAERKMLDVLRLQEGTVVSKDYLAFTQLDVAFHNLILELAGNAILLAFIHDVRAHLNRVRYLELQEAHHEQEAIDGHWKILDALRKNDVARTMEELRLHLKMLEEFREEIFARHREIFV